MSNDESPKLYHTGALAPRKYGTDAGIDLVTTEQTTVPAKGAALIPTGNRIEVPEGTFLLITARSSTFKNFGLMVFLGIIDEGYTGELMASVYNPGDTDVVINVGDRVCQVLVLPNLLSGVAPQLVEMIRGHERGENGFGSTGRSSQLRAV